jgi:NlpC/P60 family
MEVGLAARRGEVTGSWKAALGASVVLAAGAGPLAASAAAATVSPVERASATAVSILSPDGHAAGGTPTVFAWQQPVAGSGYHFPDDGSLVRIGDVTASAERASGDAIGASGAVVLRTVELFGGALQVDVIRARASLAASDGTVADGSVSHLLHVRLNGDPVKLVPGMKLWVKGFGYAVVDDPVARTGATNAGDTLAGLRLHLTSAHSGLPAGTDIVLGAVHADLAHVPPAPAAGQGGSGGGDGGGTLPDRQAKAPGTHGRRVRATKDGRRHPAHDGTTAGRRHRHAQRRPEPVPVVHPPTPPLHAAHGSGARAAVVRAALAQVGWPYVWGGESRAEGGFDCSGLVDHAYARAGYPLPGRPTAQVLWSMSVPVGRNDLRPGDLVFLGTRAGYAHHVGLYAGGGWVIAAPHRGAAVEVELLSAVPWDGFGRILKAPRGRGLGAHGLAARDRQAVSQPRRESPPPAKTAAAPGPAPAPTSRPAPHRQPSTPAPPKRHRGERLAALPREDFRHWAISLLTSFRGAGR